MGETWSIIYQGLHKSSEEWREVYKSEGERDGKSLHTECLRCVCVCVCVRACVCVCIFAHVLYERERLKRESV